MSPTAFSFKKKKKYKMLPFDLNFYKMLFVPDYFLRMSSLISNMLLYKKAIFIAICIKCPLNFHFFINCWGRPPTFIKYHLRLLALIKRSYKMSPVDPNFYKMPFGTDHFYRMSSTISDMFLYKRTLFIAIFIKCLLQLPFFKNCRLSPSFYKMPFMTQFLKKLDHQFLRLDHLFQKKL